MKINRQKKMRLENKIAIVTGGANGLGKAMCELFAKEGASVIAADIADMTELEQQDLHCYRLDIKFIRDSEF